MSKNATSLIKLRSMHEEHLNGITDDPTVCIHHKTITYQLSTSLSSGSTGLRLGLLIGLGPG